MCSKETYSEVCIGENVSAFPIQNHLKQGGALLLLLFSVALDCDLRKVQEKQEGMELTEAHQQLVCYDNVNILGKNIP
jgi:hypothetical protein